MSRPAIVQIKFLSESDQSLYDTGDAEDGEYVGPEYETKYAAGADIRVNEPVSLEPGERGLFGTGIKMAIPYGFEGQLRPRSGLAYRDGVTVLNSPGTIDADYRGEVKVLIINHGDEPVSYEAGERVMQLLVKPVTQALFAITEDALDDTTRGEGGFGSTGTK